MLPRKLLFVVACALLACAGAAAQQSAPQQTDDDEYTRYELLAPATASFRILYDVTATTAGAGYYWNGIRRGSEVSNIAVTDLASGKPLQWKLVDGKTARANGYAEAGDAGQYIEVALARPVAAGGEARIRIEKTYKDAASYKSAGDEITFERTLSIPRNSVALPAGYELIGVNYPSQIRSETDGRIVVSFMNTGPAEVPYKVRARKLPEKSATPPAAKAAAPRRQLPTPAGEAGESRAAARLDYTFSERAFQDREIVYFLQQPETHAFRLYHDYTETQERAGGRYINVVRTGSAVSNPSAKNLDTGEALKVETLKGDEIRKRGIDIREPVTPETEIVVVWFESVKKGTSLRLRIEETYTDPSRYLLANPDELVWDRSFGRPRNVVVLPEGWFVTANSIPAVVSLTADGKIELRFWNDRPDEIDVFIRARRR